jgi:hypothetical protein
VDKRIIIFFDLNFAKTVNFNTMKRYTRVLALTVIGAGLLHLSSCGDSSTEAPNGPVINQGGGNVDPNSGGILNIGGQVFVIPSPIQTADLIAKANVAFNAEILNPVENASKYTTTFNRALNMGIYGADLGYISIYKNTNYSTKYLKAVRGLADELGLGSAFNDDLASKINDAMSDENKMLELVSEAYKTADNYLKENQKDDVASLVIIGGWLESVYFAGNAALESKNKDIVERVADQKTVLKTILAMLKQYRDKEEYDDLAVDLEDLLTLFDKVQYTYEYIQPETDEVNKITTIKSKHTVVISDEQLNAIINKVKSIRNEIIG